MGARRIRTALMGALVGLVGMLSLVVTAPAQAELGGCGDGEMAFVTKPGCTETGIIDAYKLYGGTQLLTRADLLRNIDVYEAHGFSREWIENAPQTRLTVQNGQVWSGCDPSNGEDGLCADSATEEIQEHYIASLFPWAPRSRSLGTVACGSHSCVATSRRYPRTSRRPSSVR